MNRIRSALILVHRWLGLICAAFWLLQALTGVLAVFHWEIDDATLAGRHRPTDVTALERRATALAGATGHIDSIWSTAGSADRYDIFVDATAKAPARVVRVDGAGIILRVRAEEEWFAHGGLIATLILVHQSLLAGDTGRWVVGISGILLFSNLVLASFMAWPRANQWRPIFRLAGKASAPARIYGWHRALGLAGAIPALLIVSAGILLVFEAQTASVIGAKLRDDMAEPSPGHAQVGMAQATRIGMARHPDAALSGIIFPTIDHPVWSIHLMLPDELQSSYGKTLVGISAVDGRILLDFNAKEAPPARRFMDLRFAFHTGGMGGIAGRILVLLVGLWLVAMTVLGIMLWWKRRRPRRSPAFSAPKKLRASPSVSPCPVDEEQP